MMVVSKNKRNENWSTATVMVRTSDWLRLSRSWQFFKWNWQHFVSVNLTNWTNMYTKFHVDMLKIAISIVLTKSGTDWETDKAQLNCFCWSGIRLFSYLQRFSDHTFTSDEYLHIYSVELYSEKYNDSVFLMIVVLNWMLSGPLIFLSYCAFYFRKETFIAYPWQ